MKYIWEVTIQFSTDEELKADEVENTFLNLVSEKIWDANLVFAAEVDRFEEDEDSDNRPG